MIDRELTIKIGPREDGGLRIWSDDIPGLILSSRVPRLVLSDMGLAIYALLERGAYIKPVSKT